MPCLEHNQLVGCLAVWERGRRAERWVTGGVAERSGVEMRSYDLCSCLYCGFVQDWRGGVYVCLDLDAMTMERFGTYMDCNGTSSSIPLASLRSRYDCGVCSIASPCLNSSTLPRGRFEKL